MPDVPGHLFLKPEYQEKREVQPVTDESVGGAIGRPDVYPLAASLAGHHRSDWIIDIGCGRGNGIGRYASDFFVAGVDAGQEVESCRRTYPFGTWIEADLDKPERIPLTDHQLAGSVVVCSNLMERLVDPRPLLAELSRMRQLATSILISTPDRDRTHDPDHLGPPADPSRVREWNCAEFTRLLEASGLEPAHLGFASSGESDRHDTIIAIIEGAGTPPLESAPPWFRVLAVVTGYNEMDILPYTLRRLLDEGLEVVYIDNWSTDDAWELVASRFGDSVRTLRLPEVDTKTYDWVDLLGHVERLGIESGADWVIHHDADEIRHGPWASLGLRDSIWNVERRGFNAINHEVLDFRPVQDEPLVETGADPTEALLWWQHVMHPGNWLQVKGWQNSAQQVHLSASGGHEVQFPGRLIFPYRFLLRHYPLRSPEHARRKVFLERRSRWNQEERARGWHVQYDDATEQDTFVWPRDGFHRWDPHTFFGEFLAERLAGIGVTQGPDHAPDPRATNPPSGTLSAWRSIHRSLDCAIAELGRVNAQHATVESALHRTARLLARTNRELHRTRRDLARSDRHLAKLNHALDGALESSSWRFTAPARALLARLRRMKCAVEQGRTSRHRPAN